jgi:hypothetical protein
MNAIVKIEPIPLPDRRRPTQMPSLPAWVAWRIELLKENEQPDRTGKYRKAWTLPERAALTTAQKSALVSHIAELRRLTAETPVNANRFAGDTLAIVTKLLLVLPGQKTTETGAEAKGEAYMAALDDVPSWAVAEAARLWYRGQCDHVSAGPRGAVHNYSFSPSPAILRNIAMVEAWRVESRSRTLANLIEAEPLVEFSDEHRAEVLRRFRGLLRGAKESVHGRVPTQASDALSGEAEGT